MAIRSVFLFAPAETATAGIDAANYAIGLAKARNAQLAIFTVALDVTTPGHATDVRSVAPYLV